MKVTICSRCGHVSRDEKEANRRTCRKCGHEWNPLTTDQTPRATVPLDRLVMPDAEHIKKVREKLREWEDIFRTDKRGMAETAEAHINLLKKHLLRMGA